MNNPYFKQTDPQYKLRWPAELRDKVAASAKAYNRSMNADIIARLEQSFLRESDFSPLNMPPEELKRRLENAKSELQTQKESPHDLNLVISPEGQDGENVVISKKFFNELMEIKGALRNLSLAVLDLEKHQYNLDDAVEEWKKDNL
ncbi:Arc family DNA-binding protein [Acinetobacter baumannii]|uniref:Arc family DNA-binding protein n=1 Tax=Acinetobacter baumannii TaxID=470 RepID=UPI001D0DC791|nr:Arc family DNA-binding protein [Acinetobacter baumannii]